MQSEPKKQQTQTEKQIQNIQQQQNMPTEMDPQNTPNSEYLWDGSGPPDPTIQSLEHILRPLRHPSQGLPQQFSNTTDNLSHIHSKRSARTQWALWRNPRAFLIAALVLFATTFGVGLWLSQEIESTITTTSQTDQHQTLNEWPMLRYSGSLQTPQTLTVGQWLTTANNERAQLQVADIGTLDISENSRIRIKHSITDTEHRLELDHGTVNAHVDAPPKLLVIESDLGQIVDMGCAYTLAIDQNNEGYLHVTQGAVVIEQPNKKIHINAHKNPTTTKLPIYLPAGARIESNQNHGLCLPFFDDSDAALIRVLRQIPHTPIPMSLFQRPQDSLTLWYALERVENSNVRRILSARLLELVPELEKTTTIEALINPTDLTLSRTQHALELYWSSL